MTRRGGFWCQVIKTKNYSNYSQQISQLVNHLSHDNLFVSDVVQQVCLDIAWRQVDIHLCFEFRTYYLTHLVNVCFVNVVTDIPRNRVDVLVVATYLLA